jgi:hypothetical protein
MREPLSIWFFAGVLFLLYGVLITATGLWELSHPLLHPPVLYEKLHPAIWWGALMGIAGLVYTIRFRPRSR